jgi:hypothetical protein
MILRAERLVRHSRRFYLRLCAVCERELGLATAPGRPAVACDHGDVLLRQARRKVASLGRVGDEPTRPRPPGGRPLRTRRRARARRLVAV